MEEEKKRRSPGKNEAEKPSFDEKLTDTHTDSANEADEDREALFLNKITVKKKLTKKKNDGTVSSETLFASVPDYFEAEDLYPVEFDLKEESEIEKAAIEALGEAPSLDLMLYDGDEEHPGHESAEESAGFESFLFDYKETMANALSIAKAERKAKESEVSEPIDAAIAEEVKAEDPIEEVIAEEVKAEEPIEEAIAEEVKAEEPIEEVIAEEAKAEEPIEEVIAEEAKTEEPIEEAIAEEITAEEPIEEDIAEEVKAEEPIEEDIAEEVKAEEPIEEAIAEEDDEDIPLLVKDKPIRIEESEDENSEEANTDPLREEAEAIELLLSEDTAKDSEVKPEEGLAELSEITAFEDNDGEQLEMDLGVKAFVTSESAKEESYDTEENGEQASEDGAERTSIVRSIFDFVELFVFTLVAVMFVTTFMFRHSKVEGTSMENTLAHGDHLIVSSLFYKPDYGDIVVFSSERNDGSVLVKRVVALPGDKVDCLFADGHYRLFVNDIPVDESEYKYIGGQGDVLTEVTDYVVGEGEVFVLGDHRNVSHDSRSFLGIDQDRILGKVVLRFYPFDKFGAVD